MKKETIIIILAVAVLATILITVIVTTMVPNPWERSASGPYPRNATGPGMLGSGMMGQDMMGGGMGMQALYSADSLPVAETDARNRAVAFCKPVLSKR